MNCRRVTLLSLMLALSSPLWAGHPASSHKDPKHHADAAHAHHYGHGGPIEVLKKLRQDLKLSSEQSTALDKVIASAEERLEKARKQHQEKAADKTELTAVQRMEQHVQLMEEHARDMKVCVEEFKHFYGTLRPEQQKQVDQAFAKKHERHHGERSIHRHGDRKLKQQKSEQQQPQGAAAPVAEPAATTTTPAATPGSGDRPASADTPTSAPAPATR